MGYVGNALFCRRHLSDWFQHNTASLRDATNKHVDSESPDISDEALVQRILEEASFAPLSINFDGVQKKVSPARVSMRDFDREIEIDGVRAIRTYPFQGEKDLFETQPSTWTTVQPYGAVSAGTLTIGIEGPNDPEHLKRELDGMEKSLRDHVGWINKDIEQYNATLAPKIVNHVNTRRAYLASIAQLKDGI